ncbi:MAG: ATP-dependent helicase [Candidatus Micrarchaeota archaeon]
MSISYSQELNPEQMQIIDNASGVCLIIAGPGSGKTRTILYKIAKLIEDGNSPESILLLTFTNRAAQEMKNRLEKLVGIGAKRVIAGTFHSFANILLRRHASLIGFNNKFTILDEQDSVSLLKKIISDRKALTGSTEVSSNGKKTKKKDELAGNDLKRLISLSKLRMISLEDLVMHSELIYLKDNLQELNLITERYATIKKNTNCMDFDDLLVYLYILFRDNENLRKFYSGIYLSIFVDEFQDTDKLQSATLDLLYDKDRTKNFIVVGDESQSIYSFRGAEIQNILKFKDKHQAKVFYLLKNYRSTKQIVELVNEVIKNSKEALEKQLDAVGEHKDAQVPVLIAVNNRKEEAFAIADGIEEQVACKESVAVLFRSVYLASELELELSKRGITYELRGGLQFFDQQHVKDLVALLKLCVNKNDFASLKRLFLLFPGIGEKKAEDMTNLVQKHSVDDFKKSIENIRHLSPLVFEKLNFSLENKNAAGVLSAFYECFYSGYMKEYFDDFAERQLDIDALISVASQYENIEEFVSVFVLNNNDSFKKKNKDSSEPKVILSTIHQAKGLEWDNVYVMGLAESLFPSAKASYLEEERRLFYVASSRAKKRLFMTYPRVADRFYKFEELPVSRFVAELPETVYRIEKSWSEGD